jgi:hypothetical protein
LSSPPGASGHGGADLHLLDAFAAALRNSQRDPLTSAREALESHFIGFAAEESRRTGATIEMDDFRRRANQPTRHGGAG